MTTQSGSPASSEYGQQADEHPTAESFAVTTRADVERLRERLEIAINNIDVALAVIDKNWRFVYVNDAGSELAYRANGITREQLLHMTMDEAFPEVKNSRVYAAVKRALQEQVSITLEDYLEPYDMWSEYRIFPASGDLAILTIDITERKQAEREHAKLNAKLERYAQMLRRSNEELQQFAYVASHDLQEPLRMITSYLQLLEARYGDRLDQEAHDFIGFAMDGATRMQVMITDLLAYSRVESAELVFEEFDAQAALDRALANLAFKIEDSGTEITQDPLPHIKADPTQITQLFQNLISNAIKFRAARPSLIHIGVERKNGEWQFSVRDNGIGIEPEALDRIFIIFQRLHLRGTYPGTGIGLAICKKVVERHNGRIWVESVPNEGTIFYFTLPVEPETGA